MKKALLLIMLFSWCSIHAQDSLQRFYIPLHQYIQSGKKLTQKDSLNFKFHLGDTLVEVDENYHRPKKNEVRVAYEPKDPAFLEIYKDVVYRTNRKGKENTMKYWKDKVKIYFDKSVPLEHVDSLMNFALKISKGIDSLQIEQVGDKSNSNYYIYYLNRKDNIDYEPRITGKMGGYYVNWNKYQQINKAFLKINTENAQRDDFQLEVLKYYFFRSMGYFSSSERLPCKSYLSACQESRELTFIDHELLAYHYSYGIYKGVNLEGFEEFHREMQQKLTIDPDARLFLVHPNN